MVQGWLSPQPHRCRRGELKYVKIKVKNTFVAIGGRDLIPIADPSPNNSKINTEGFIDAVIENLIGKL